MDNANSFDAKLHGDLDVVIDALAQGGNVIRKNHQGATAGRGIMHSMSLIVADIVLS